MNTDAVTSTPVESKLVDNVLHFCRALRKAGVKVGTAQLTTALQAVAAVGFTSKVDFYYTLRATLITREENLKVFHQVFSLFWRNPEFLQQIMLMPESATPDQATDASKAAAQRRASDALHDQDGSIPRQQEVIQDSALTMSDTDVLRSKDFDQMSVAELREAENAIKNLSFKAPYPPGRRYRTSPLGTVIDARATMRAALRQHGELQRIERMRPRDKLPNLVVLCDISGSMSVYSRMFMRFLHALSHARVRQWNKVHAFTFGTRLTNVSRALSRPDIDDALSAVGAEATDWEGGTLIGPTIKQFNRQWARRVLNRGAVMLFISDGLERGDTDLLSAEMKRMSLFSRHLVWLNPLLRWDGFSPRASGIKAILPHVDSFHACHSLDSLDTLTATLMQTDNRSRTVKKRTRSP